MDHKNTNKVVSAVIGNALEWYDFLIYGFLATTIAKLFFPASNDSSALLMALATFGVGFLLRPVGGVLIGYYADRHGRKAALLLIIAMMTFAVALMSFTPTAATIGIAAPIIILISRMIQGFATGGEYASSTAFLVEAAPEQHKGLYGSLQFFGQSLAILVGSAVAAIVTYVLTEAQLLSWGWRIPFILGLLICPVGLWIRSRIDENEEYIQSKASAFDHHHTIKYTVMRSYKQILMSMGLTISATASVYVVMLTTPTYAATKLGIKLSDALFIQAAAVSIMIVVVPLAGYISDRVGRKPVLFAGLLIILFGTIPLFHLVITQPTLAHLMLMQCALCVGIAILFGPSPAAISEQFSTLGRTTAMSIAYNLAVMIFGGFAPFMVTWLGGRYDLMAPAYYLVFAMLIGLIAVYCLRETAPIKRIAQTQST